MGIICLYVLIQKSGQKTAKSHLCAPVEEIIWVKNVVVISTQIRLDWLRYLAGNSQTGFKIFFIFSGYIFLNLRIHKPHF